MGLFVVRANMLTIKSLQRAKRIIKIVSAFTLLIVGAAMLVLPGPGILVIAVALAVLATEFMWARRLLDRIKSRARPKRGGRQS